ncbi:unnamed protein product [Diamesa tonsa]
MHQQFLSSACGQLSYMSSDELREYLNDDDKLDEKVNEILKSLETEKDVIISENRSLAESNLEKEPQIIECRSRINDLSSSGKELCESVQEKLNEIKSKSNNMNSETVLALLQTSAAENEEESESFAKQLMDNNSSVEEFMDKFMTSRKIMHLRKLKSEKMQDLLRQGPQQGNNRMGHGGGPPPQMTYGGPQNPSTFYPPAGGIPYPMGPITMPMPGQYNRPY